MRAHASESPKLICPNTLKNSRRIAEAEHVDFREGLARQRVVAADGTDITEMVEKAVVWLAEHSF